MVGQALDAIIARARRTIVSQKGETQTSALNPSSRQMISGKRLATNTAPQSQARAFQASDCGRSVTFSGTHTFSERQGKNAVIRNLSKQFAGLHPAKNCADFCAER